MTNMYKSIRSKYLREFLFLTLFCCCVLLYHKTSTQDLKRHLHGFWTEEQQQLNKSELQNLGNKQGSQSEAQNLSKMQANQSEPLNLEKEQGNQSKPQNLSKMEGNQSETQNSDHKTINSPTKVILAWTKWYNLDFASHGHRHMNACPHLNCIITNNTSLINVSHAVIFHIRTSMRFEFPKWRHPWQRYIFYLEESPPHSVYAMTNQGAFRNTTDYFNWTMTYRRDSDIFNPYGYIDRHTNVFSLEDSVIDSSMRPALNSSELKNLVKNKSKFGVWLASYCGTNSKREILMNALQKVLSIDVWGLCGNKTGCPKSENAHCLEVMNSDYKFIFALENSICKDYVTEKFWSRAQLNIVPIVLNRNILTPFAPGDTFIAVDDFNNLNEMVLFLKDLDQNDTKYMEYILARDKPRNISQFIHSKSEHRGWCRLCELLHTPDVPYKSYHDIVGWWTKDQCQYKKRSLAQFFKV